MCIHISSCEFFLSYVPTFVGLQARVDGIFDFCPLAACAKNVWPEFVHRNFSHKRVHIWVSIYDNTYMHTHI